MGQTKPARGFSLLFVMTMLSLLFVSSAVLLRRSGSFAALTGGRVQGDKANEVANSAAGMGCQMLEQLLYGSGSDASTAPMDLSKVRALPRLAANDPLCADGIDCSQFYLVSANQAVGTEGASMRVAVTCNPGACQGTPAGLLNFQLRVQGTLKGRTTPLLEVSLVQANN